MLLDFWDWESDNTSTSGDPITPLFRAQPEHAIGKSRPAGTAKNYYRPGDAERPPKVRMTIDEDSRDSEPHTQRHAQAAIHPPQIQNHCHSSYLTARCQPRVPALPFVRSAQINCQT